MKRVILSLHQAPLEWNHEINGYGDLYSYIEIVPGEWQEQKVTISITLWEEFGFSCYK